ncbi:hypothetical protein Bxe_A2413 [Paraburkholderia xenovorans LB400]|uniref:Uncharacterized protein n=1 Tax=Paraburkholderia xenovorans (strain LB400) TaxID=266265 RepID=Q13ZD3_PARXL|nr:hypothetical protein Bxe_A2413 [Paraburkholderia xenovorans LB400]
MTTASSTFNASAQIVADGLSGAFQQGAPGRSEFSRSASCVPDNPRHTSESTAQIGRDVRQREPLRMSDRPAWQTLLALLSRSSARACWKCLKSPP